MPSRVASATPPILDQGPLTVPTRPPPPVTHVPVHVVAERAASERPAPIVGVRPVVVAGESSRPPRTCGRCRGIVDAGTQFCMFCGAPVPPALPTDRVPTEESPRAEPRPAGSGRPSRSPPDFRDAREAPRFEPSPAPSPRPAPVEAARGRLVVIARSGVDGPTYPIGESTDIGRTEGQVIIAEDAYLSPRHARLAFRQGRLFLWDLGSTNGVYLQLSAARTLRRGERAGFGLPPAAPHGSPAGRPTEPNEVVVPLEDQDLILVGQQVLRFEIESHHDEEPGPATEHGTRVFGSPATPRYARLAQRTVEGVTRDVYYIRKVETVLGRESGDVVFAEDPFLSRRHAAVRVLEGEGSNRPRFALVDLGSSNGTFLRLRREVELVSGDHFRIGQQLFRVDFETPALRPATGNEPRKDGLKG